MNIFNVVIGRESILMIEHDIYGVVCQGPNFVIDTILLL